MLSSMIHHPCEIALHLLSEDIFIHPPPPNSELPGHDQTLRGVVEIKAPTERTITGLRVTLQAVQTLAIPDNKDSHGAASISGVRWEEKTVMDKSVEILGDGEGGIVKQHKNRGRGKGKEKEKGSSQVKHLEAAVESMDLSALTGTSGVPNEGLDEEKRDDGIHLTKGIHGFEFSFIIPASSPPFERSKHGRVRYLVTATALGAGRARHNISAWREIFVILNVDKDGGPIPLEITYADIHEALGPISLSLTAASLTVGGTVTLTVVHPDPPPKLNVHVIRVFCEQTFELYSELKKAWLKLPPEKLRVAEWGHMPNKPQRPLPLSQQVHTDPSDIIWCASQDDDCGKPGKGAFHALPTVAPYGQAIPHSSLANSGHTTPASGPSLSPQASNILLSSGAGSPLPLRSGSGHATPANNRKGYKLKATVRLPNDDHMRPSTVRGSRAEIRVAHEMGVEVFFSREDVLDTREGTENYGKPKVQVFSARRSVVVPSCTATFDTVHLPPYVEESPISSRPPSPSNLARNQANNAASSPQNVSGHASSSNKSSNNAVIGNHANADLQKLAVTLHNTLPGGRGRADPLSSEPHSNFGSRQGSRDPSPTRPHLERGSSSHSIGHSISAAFGGHFPHGMGRKSRPASRTNSRPASPTHESSGNHSLSTSPAGAASHPSHRGRRFGSNFQGFTPALATQTTSAPASGAATPLHHPIYHAAGSIHSGHHHPHHNGPSTLPPNSPWGPSHLPHRTGNSHDTCNCGRTTEELAGAEHRLLDGVPTAPGMFSETHGHDEEPPAWSESRPPSPDYFSQVFANTTSRSAVNTPAVGGIFQEGNDSGKSGFVSSPMW